MKNRQKVFTVHFYENVKEKELVFATVKTHKKPLKYFLKNNAAYRKKEIFKEVNKMLELQKENFIFPKSKIINLYSELCVLVNTNIS